jgi:hypothetical protein
MDNVKASEEGWQVQVFRLGKLGLKGTIYRGGTLASPQECLTVICGLHPPDDCLVLCAAENHGLKIAVTIRGDFCRVIKMGRPLRKARARTGNGYKGRPGWQVKSTMRSTSALASQGYVVC